MPLRLPKAASILGILLGSALPGLLADAVRAENDPFGSTSRFFYDEQQRAHPVPDAHIRPAPTVRQGSSRIAVPARPPRPLGLAAQPRKAPTIAVVVYGDRLGQALARGLEDDAGEWLAVTALTSEDAGLTRTDFTDWLQSVRGRLQKADRPSAAVVMLGSNDRQGLPDGAATADPSSPRWPSLYAARIDAFAAVFREAHVPLIWVGLPSVHGDEASADFVRLNALFRDHAGQEGAAFVDSWEAFSDDTGSYNPMGPDVDGRMVKLRKADGFGFTRAGSRKLASFVEGDIRRLQAPPATVDAPAQVADITIEKARDFDSALDIDVNAQIQREAGLSPDGAAAAGKAPALPQKPAAGPVLSLTAAPLSPDGVLVTASIPPSGALQAALVVKPADTGSPPAASRTGRADDFSWPKP